MQPYMTKHAMETSLKNLLLVKPFNKITVRDITEDCGISRMTFYYHFKDIYDLAEWVFIESASKAVGSNKDYGNWQQGFLNICTLLLENKPFISNVYRNASREQLEHYLYKLAHQLLMSVIEELSDGIAISDRDKAFIAEIYQYSFVGLLLNWVGDGMREDPQYMVVRLNSLICGSIARSLDELCTDRRITAEA